MRNPATQAADHAAAYLRDVATEPPRVGIILGSGLGGLVEALEAPHAVPFGDVPGFPRTGVQGHGGRVVFGRLEGLPCVVLAGRAHLYEGHAAEEVTLPARALVGLGIEALVVTSAAGGIDRTFNPGDLMIVSDHIDLMSRYGVVTSRRGLPERVGTAGGGERERGARANFGGNCGRGSGAEARALAARVPRAATRLPVYDLPLRRLAEHVALDEGIRIVHGVYCAVLGPSYETPAEIRMLARLGADAVGMSMVPEATVACAAGVPVLGISLITNRAAGLTAEHLLAHDDVLASAAAAAPRFERLVRGVLSRM